MDPYGASSSSTSSNNDLPGRIRKRRYSTARIQPTRIKKVMQSDEDIGRMVSSVPVAIGSAMEHFAEKLLENAQDVMHRSASKTLAPAHIFAAISRTEYLKSFLEPVINNFGGGGPAASSSPVTTPTNGLMTRPFENLSTSSPMEEKFDLNALMRDTAKTQLASNMSTASSAGGTVHTSTSDEGKRRGRGRPKKLDEKEKPKATITILSPPNGQSIISTISSSTNGISTTKAEIDKLMMPPPLFVPQRKPQKVIIPKTLISSNTSSNTSSSATTASPQSTTMVSTNSTDQISA